MSQNIPLAWATLELSDAVGGVCISILESLQHTNPAQHVWGRSGLWRQNGGYYSLWTARGASWHLSIIIIEHNSKMETEHNPTTEAVQKKISMHFGDPSNADITFVSKDDVHFYIQRKYIEATSGGFPPSEFDTRGETVPLEESSDTLELLFQFMYPRRPPMLAGIAFEILSPLAEAAEKYEVFSAMGFCHIEIKNVLPNHPAPILVYAARHGYATLVDEAAPSLLGSPLADVAMSLPQNLILSWVRYYGEWIKVLQVASTFCPFLPLRSWKKLSEAEGRRIEEVARWKSHRGTDILARCLAGNVGSLRKLDTIMATVKSEIPTIPVNILDEWERDVSLAIAKIPTLSSLL